MISPQLVVEAEFLQLARDQLQSRYGVRIQIWAECRFSMQAAVAAEGSNEGGDGRGRGRGTRRERTCELTAKNLKKYFIWEPVPAVF
jgi:hypothetical protein